VHVPQEDKTTWTGLFQGCLYLGGCGQSAVKIDGGLVAVCLVGLVESLGKIKAEAVGYRVDDYSPEGGIGEDELPTGRFQL